MHAESSNEIAETRSWWALAGLILIATLTILRWHRLAWLWALFAVVLFFRAGAFVMGARAAGKDPEEDLQKRREKQASNDG